MTGDVGQKIFCIETGTNPFGVGLGHSNVVGPVPVPANAYEFLGHVTASWGATSAMPYTSPAMDTTGAGLLVVAHGMPREGAPYQTFTDNKGNIWYPCRRYTTPGANTVGVWNWFCIPTTVGPGHTVTVNGYGYDSFTFMAFSGGICADAYECLDVQSGGPGSTGLTCTASAGVTPTLPNSLVISTGAVLDPTAVGGTTHSTISSPFNKLTSIVSGSHIGTCAAYRIQTTPVALDNPTWTTVLGFDQNTGLTVFSSTPLTHVPTTFDPVWSNATLSGGNLTIANSVGGVWQAGRSIKANSFGKRFCQITVTSVGANSVVGINDETATPSTVGFAFGYAWYPDGSIYNNGVPTTGYPTFTTGDVLDLAVDFDNRFFAVRKNGGNWNNNVANNPAVGAMTYPSYRLANIFIYANVYEAGSSLTANFGATAFTTTPPAGFRKW